MRWFGRWRLLARRSRVFALTPCVLLSHRAGEGESAPLEGVGFLQARLPVEPPSKAFPLPCERDACAPSTRCAGNAGVPPAIPTTREKTYPSNTSRRASVHKKLQLPPSLRFPLLAA